MAQTYLYVFTFADALPVTTDQLRRISDLIADLNYYASFYAYGSPATADSYLSKVENVIAQIETIVPPP